MGAGEMVYKNHQVAAEEWVTFAMKSVYSVGDRHQGAVKEWAGSFKSMQLWAGTRYAADNVGGDLVHYSIDS